MRFLRNLRYIALFSVFVFLIFSFSCCAMPVQHGSSAHSDHVRISKESNILCCSIFMAGHYSVVHNQPVDAPGIFFFAIAILSSLLSFVFLWSEKGAPRFILYQYAARLMREHPRPYNPFAFIFSQGILHPKNF